MFIIFRKELADYFTSVRCLILFLLIIAASALTLYADYEGVRGVSSKGFVFLSLFTTSSEKVPFTFVFFLGMLVPIMGMILGFDAINSERTGGTISRVLSQPLYRDSVINGKFLAGIITMSIMIIAMVLIVAGYGLSMIGVTPTVEEVLRLILYIVFAIIFGAFWMGLSMLFSVLSKRVSTSLLSSIGVWLLFTFFIYMIASAVANGVAPVNVSNPTLEELVKYEEVSQAVSRISPNQLFAEAANALLSPQLAGTFGYWTIVKQSSYMILNPLSLGQSAILIWPQLTTLLSLTLIVFAISYVVFMRQEIRST